MTTVFDEPTRLMHDDLAHLHEQLEMLLVLIALDPNIETMHRIYHEIDRSRLTDFTDDIERALGGDDT